MIKMLFLEVFRLKKTLRGLSGDVFYNSSKNNSLMFSRIKVILGTWNVLNLFSMFPNIFFSIILHICKIIF